MAVRTLQINGKAVTIAAETDRMLLSVLREDLDLTGAKYGCGEGQCGACTVLLDGAAVRSCVTPVRVAVGKQITTIEGLEQDGQLHPLQRAFLDVTAFQCGFCTPGMIMAAAALLRHNPNPSDADIRRTLDANICRCGAFGRIVTAVRLAAAASR